MLAVDRRTLGQKKKYFQGTVLCHSFTHREMRLTLSLARHVTFFTRPGCGLCEQAKRNLSDTWEQCKEKFEYEEVNIMKPENKQWYDKYVSVAAIKRKLDIKYVKTKIN